MSLSKKHYETIAFRIKQQALKATSAETRSALRDLVDDLCDEFSRDNAAFRTWAFVTATGTADFTVIR
jgi:hypothetical protein